MAKKKVISDSEVLLLLSFKKEYDTLKVDNPLGISRLKRKTVLEYLSQRIVLLAQEIEEASKARVFLQDQKDKLDADSKATKSYEKLDEDYN